MVANLRKLFGSVVLIAGLFLLISQMPTNFYEVMWQSSMHFFLLVLFLSFALLWWIRGSSGLIEAMVVLPIPLAIAVACFSSVSVLTDLNEETLKEFGVAMAPLAGAALIVSIGYAFKDRMASANASGSRERPTVPKAMLYFISLCVFYVLPYIFFVQKDASFVPMGYLYVPEATFPCLLVSVSLLLLNSPTSQGWDFFSSQVLKAAFIVGSITLVFYIFMVFDLVFAPDLRALGDSLAFSWICLHFFSVLLFFSHWFQIAYGEQLANEAIRRNWHFVELAAFYIFLSIAPPTIFDIHTLD